MTNPSQVATHLAFNALFAFEEKSARWPTPGSEADLGALQAHIDARLNEVGYVEEEEEVAQDDASTQVDEAATGSANLKFRQHVTNAVGEMCVGLSSLLLIAE